MKSFVGFLVIGAGAALLLAKSPALLLPLLIGGGVMLGLFLLAFVVWYGLVQIRIFFKI